MKLPASINTSDFFIHAGTLLLALLCGLIASQGELKFIVLLMGIILAPLLILSQARKVLIGALLLNFIIVGMVGYFGRFQQMHWITDLLFAALAVRILFDMLSYRDRNRQQPLTLVFVFLAGFCASTFISIAVNQSPPLQAILGIKHYLFPLSLTALIVYGSLNSSFWLKVWRAIPLFTILQLPIALYQYFVVGRQRAQGIAIEGKIAWDSVVGTFGGAPEGGGASGALALFLCFAIVATLALRRGKLISGTLAITACVSALLVIILAEVKAVIFFLPFAVLAYQRHKVFTSLPSVILWVGGTAIFIPALLLMYNSLHYSESGSNYSSLSEIVEYAFNAEASVDTYNRATGELSRMNALRTWWQENVAAGAPLDAVFGHGPAASEISSTFGTGVAAKRYLFVLNTSTLSALLWDVGLLGSLSLMAALVAAAKSAFSTANFVADTDPVLRAIYEACGVGALLLVIDLPYDPSVGNNPVIQSMLATIFGLVLIAKQLTVPLTHSRDNINHLKNTFTP